MQQGARWVKSQLLDQIWSAKLATWTLRKANFDIPCRKVEKTTCSTHTSLVAELWYWFYASEDHSFIIINHAAFALLGTRVCWRNKVCHERRCHDRCWWDIGEPRVDEQTPWTWTWTSGATSHSQDHELRGFKVINLQWPWWLWPEENEHRWTWPHRPEQDQGI